MKKLIALAAVLALAGCATEPAPAVPDPPALTTPASTSPAPSPSLPRDVGPSPTDTKLPTVTAGAYCPTLGAKGVTKPGKRMECKGPGRPRWRAA